MEGKEDSFGKHRRYYTPAERSMHNCAEVRHAHDIRESNYKTDLTFTEVGYLIHANTHANTPYIPSCTYSSLHGMLIFIPISCRVSNSSYKCVIHAVWKWPGTNACHLAARIHLTQEYTRLVAFVSYLHVTIVDECIFSSYHFRIICTNWPRVFGFTPCFNFTLGLLGVHFRESIRLHRAHTGKSRYTEDHCMV